MFGKQAFLLRSTVWSSRLLPLSKKYHTYIPDVFPSAIKDNELAIGWIIAVSPLTTQPMVTPDLLNKKHVWTRGAKALVVQQCQCNALIHKEKSTNLELTFDELSVIWQEYESAEEHKQFLLHLFWFVCGVTLWNTDWHMGCMTTTTRIFWIGVSTRKNQWVTRAQKMWSWIGSLGISWHALW